MSALKLESPHGVLRRGWSAAVEDYAIAGAWLQGGDVLVVGDADGGVNAFHARSGASLWSRRKVHDGGLLALSAHPDGAMLATAGQDGRALVWDVLSGKVREVLELGGGWVEHIAWSPDGARLAASASRHLQVFGLRDGVSWRSEPHPSTISALAWSGAAELATACYGQVTFFNAATGDKSQELKWKGSLISMVISPDGRLVACGSQDSSVHFWRRATAQDSMMSGYAGKPSALAFDNTSQLLATGGGEAVTVWSFQGEGPEGTHPGILELHLQPITSLAFARQAPWLASGARDGSVVIWSLRGDGEGTPIGGALSGGAIARLLWRPDGRALAALDSRGGITVWRVGR